MLSAEVLACADFALRRVGTVGFGDEVDESVGSGKGREREMAAKLQWVDKRIAFHCEHWKAFEKQFIAHFVQRVSGAANMTTDETMSAGVSGRGGSGKGKGKERANDGQVRPPTRLRPVCTPTTFLQTVFKCACSTSNIFRMLLRKNHVRGIAQCLIVQTEYALTWCGSDPVICSAESQDYLHARTSVKAPSWRPLVQ